MRLTSLVLAATILTLSFLIGGNLIAGGAEEQVCDTGADYSLELSRSYSGSGSPSPPVSE